MIGGPRNEEEQFGSSRNLDFSRPYNLNQKLEPVSKNSIKLGPSTSDYLVTFSTRSQKYCVGFVDVVNSTKISASLSSSKISKYYEIFLKLNV